MSITSFQLKTEIKSGFDTVKQLDLSQYKRVFIATDKIMRQIGLCDIVTNILDQKSIPYQIFDEIEPNPSFDTVQKGVKQLMLFNSDVIIAIGGGSVIDAAKAFMYFALEVTDQLDNNKTKPVFIAIPTTSGTGSEVTSYSVVTDLKNHVKIPIVSENIIPDIAILDPVFTMSCPPKVTSETGFDVLTHVLESYVSVNSNNFTEPLVEKVVKMVFDNLYQVYAHGDDKEARLLMHEASCLAGIAFTNTGLGLNHAMAHSLGGRFPIPHGRANALLMPHVIAFNSKVVGHKYAQLAVLLDLPHATVEEGCISLITAVSILNQKVDLPSSVLDFGISREEYMKTIPEMAKIAQADPCLTTNPIQASVSEIEQIYFNLL